jgi:hypothetical protein
MRRADAAGKRSDARWCGPEVEWARRRRLELEHSADSPARRVWRAVRLPAARTACPARALLWARLWGRAARAYGGAIWTCEQCGEPMPHTGAGRRGATMCSAECRGREARALPAQAAAAECGACGEPTRQFSSYYRAHHTRR